MAWYTSQHLAFDVSDDWVDQSITAFRIPARPGRGDASFVVTSDPTRSGKDFEKYLSEQRSKCESSLPELEMVRSDLLEAHGRAMGWLEFTWKNDGKVIQIRQVFFDCDPLAVICTLTAAPHDVPLLNDSWRDLMGSVQFPAAKESQSFQPKPLQR